MLFMGARDSGKGRLINALTGNTAASDHSMAVEFFGEYINTPSEFLENRFFYTSLITASLDCHIIAAVQSAVRTISLYPPLFTAMFNCRVVGVITDIEDPKARPDLAERFLRSAGARECFSVNITTGDGLDNVRALLG